MSEGKGKGRAAQAIRHGVDGSLQERHQPPSDFAHADAGWQAEAAR